MRHTSEEKRLKILQSAAEAFAEKGYYDTSVQNITERAGVSTGTFYIYYKNKEEILLSLYNQFAEKAKLAISQTASGNFADSAEKLAVCTLSLLKLYSGNTKLSLILLTKTIGLNKTAEEHYYNIFKEISMLIHSIISDMDIPFASDKYILSVAFLQVVNGLAAQWLADPSEETFPELCYTVLKYNFNALSIKICSDKINALIAANIERNDN